jgi:hypothetical protein
MLCPNLCIAYDYIAMRCNVLFACIQKAEHRWRATLAWRKEHHIDRILQEPQEHFWTIKELCPHFLHGRSARDSDGQGAGVSVRKKCSFSAIAWVVMT